MVSRPSNALDRCGWVEKRTRRRRYLQQVFLRMQQIFEDGLDDVLVVESLDVVDQVAGEDQLRLDLGQTELNRIQF